MRAHLNAIGKLLIAIMCIITSCVVTVFLWQIGLFAWVGEPIIAYFFAGIIGIFLSVAPALILIRAIP